MVKIMILATTHVFQWLSLIDVRETKRQGEAVLAAACSS